MKKKATSVRNKRIDIIENVSPTARSRLLDGRTYVLLQFFLCSYIAVYLATLAHLAAPHLSYTAINRKPATDRWVRQSSSVGYCTLQPPVNHMFSSTQSDDDRDITIDFYICDKARSVNSQIRKLIFLKTLKNQAVLLYSTSRSLRLRLFRKCLTISVDFYRLPLQSLRKFIWFLIILIFVFV